MSNRLPRFLRSLGLALVLLIPAPWTGAKTIHSDAKGYSIDIPEGWVQVPEDVVANYSAAIQRNSGQNMRWDRAYQPEKEQGWLQGVYVLVSIIPLPGPVPPDRFDDAVRAMTNKKNIVRANQNSSKEFQTALKSEVFDRPIVDKERCRYLYGFSLEVPGAGKIKALTAGYFGRKSIGQLVFRCKPDEWDQYADARNVIVDSFRWDPEEAYNMALATRAAGDRYSGARGLIQAATYVSVGALILALVFALLRSRRAKRDQ